ncbi:hypothetical protein [Nocardiopsis sp. ATB16-24]|uniref:hypothetical protein n=1 Tax=Nocardiopsis sp. ATB16-24 TaxID=3019555 RepID=UPI002553454B|nr:hypothetical protein [Nocardiopsis sp. ATB16-24]
MEETVPSHGSRTPARPWPGTGGRASSGGEGTVGVPGTPDFVEAARGRVRLFPSAHAGDARPDTLVHLRVRGVDVSAAEFGATVGKTPWGREVELRDPDGHR